MTRPRVGGGLILSVVVLQYLWLGVVVAFSAKSYGYRHALKPMAGTTAAVVADVLFTYVLLIAVIAAFAGLMRRRRWGWVAAVFVNVSLVGIPPLVLWLCIRWFFSDLGASIDAPVVSLISLVVAAPFMAPGVRQAFS